jgi:peptidyl-dipeptidase A
MKNLVSLAALAVATLSIPSIAQAQEAAAVSAAPSVAEAEAFLARVEKDLFDFSVEGGRVAWVNNTYITDDTDALAAKYGEIGTEKSVQYALEAAKYQNVSGLSAEAKRKLDILRGGLVLPAPTTPGSAKELSEIATKLNSAYGKGKGTLKGQPINGSDIEAEMGTNRNPEELKEMWVSWHDNVGGPMKNDYVRMAEIANKGAQELGFADLGAMWRSGYDMPADDFAKLTDKLWLEVKPLYDELHTYVRTQLNKKYGDAVQGKTGAIRADLLGNMWAQEWGDIYDIVAPAGSGDIGYDIGELVKAKKVDEIGMVKIGEGFFSSLGFAPLPETFYARSQFLKPADREVVCHASAWNITNIDDLRIKMCIKINSNDFVTVHHELGHNYYQRAYNKQSFLHLNGANDGFHEAIGLLDAAKVPSADKDNGLLLRQAMDKVAFLPFSVIVDKWRWGVFAGDIKPDDYNTAWTKLRTQYQGIVPPVERSANAFDAGAKYHVPGNTPYTRYFLARILQFQFYKAACDTAGWKGPLHRCSFYGNKEVGKRLNAMLEMGASKPWPDALEAFTGTREMSGKAMLEYFAPLMKWLKTQNKGAKKGW